MKILYLTDQIYLHGGIEKVLSQKANYLAEVSGDEVIIVTYNQNGRPPVYHFSEKIQSIDLGVNYQISKSYFHPANLKKIPRHRKALKSILQKIQPDMVISCSFGPDFYFIPYLEKHLPKIKEFHSSRYLYRQKSTSLKSKVFKRVDSFTEQNYHQLVVLNDSEIPFYKGKRCTVIPNPVELRGGRGNSASTQIIAAGRISPVKNFGDLIDAFALIADRFPEWSLHFFGEDYVDTQSLLQERINVLGLQNQIRFKGVVSDFQKEMKNYSIYVMTSETECFPMVLLEALSVGMPVISYDSPTGPRHILKDAEDSFLIPYKNLDIFTERLKHLMLNENLRREMGEKGVENVQRFNIDKVMALWKDLFNKLTACL